MLGASYEPSSSLGLGNIANDHERSFCLHGAHTEVGGTQATVE